MRGLRFAASLDFDIEEKTFQAMTSHAFLLERFRLSEVSSSLISCSWHHIGKKGSRLF